ncbi:hypothetical protein [uncultured Alistipes sp.]|uniref:hypothetical protein n=1 Tax=uncultured Alistipes sp. TaxID=538949 RepID=UPI00272CB5F8|nr:hypothetical protein [uncultured Alistipes sp.]
MGIINAKDESYGFPSKVEDGSVLSLVVSNDNTYNYVESVGYRIDPNPKLSFHCHAGKTSVGFYQRIVEQSEELSERYVEEILENGPFDV